MKNPDPQTEDPTGEPGRRLASASPCPRAGAGFTLFEMLVAMAVMAFLLLMLLNFLDAATRLWRTNANQAEAYREARAAIGVIARDLQNLAATTNRSHFLWNADAIGQLAGTDGAAAGSAVFFLSWLPPHAQDPAANRGDICEVGYFLAFARTPSSPAPTLNLYRYFRSSDFTFPAIASGSGHFAGAAANSAATEVLAHHVTGFSLQAFTSTNSSLAAFTPSAATPTPDLVVITLSAISREVAARLDPELASWTNADSPVIAPAAQTFTTHIRLPRSP